MRVLFDENLDWRLRRFLEPDHAVTTVGERGWSGKRNGELLRLAEAEFDVLVTLDKNMRHQQLLGDRDLAFVLIESRTSRRQDIEPLMTRVADVLSSARSGLLYIVTA